MRSVHDLPNATTCSAGRRRDRCALASVASAEEAAAGVPLVGVCSGWFGPTFQSVMGPHSDDLHRPPLGINLIDKSVLNIDAAGTGSIEIAKQLSNRGGV